MQTPGKQRDRMAEGAYIPKDKEEALGRFENAFALAVQGDAVAKKIYKAVKAKQLPKDRPAKLVPKAVEAGIITADEAQVIQQAEAARWDAIQVDSFDLDDYKRHYQKPAPATTQTPVIASEGDGAGDGATTPAIEA